MMFWRRKKSPDKLFEQVFHAHFDSLGVETVRRLIETGDQYNDLVPDCVKEFCLEHRWREDEKSR